MYVFRQTTTEPPFLEPLEPFVPPAAAVGTTMIAMGAMVMMTNLNFQQDGQIPRNFPQPGDALGVGGGSPSNGNIRTLPQSLALVPGGLTAVAVFPPFSR